MLEPVRKAADDSYLSDLSAPVERRRPHPPTLGWRSKQRADHRRPAVAAHTQDEECHLRHQDSPQSFAAAAAAPSNACVVGGTRNSFCNFHIAIEDEKASATKAIAKSS
jgi:hypothetical protein